MNILTFHTLNCSWQHRLRMFVKADRFQRQAIRRVDFNILKLKVALNIPSASTIPKLLNPHDLIANVVRSFILYFH